jgi:hypothetical protein
LTLFLCLLNPISSKSFTSSKGYSTTN